jgi:hypothetical protein
MCSDTTEKTCQCFAKVRGCSIQGLTEKCGKPAKGARNDGTPACGIHLRQEQKRIEQSTKYRNFMNVEKEKEKKQDRILRVAKWYAAEEHDGVDLWLGYSSTDQELYCKYAEKIIAVVEGK